MSCATAVFVEFGLELLGEGLAEGDWVDRVVGLEGVRTEVAMLQTQTATDGSSSWSSTTRRSRAAMDTLRLSTLGLRRIAFAVGDID